MIYREDVVVNILGYLLTLSQSKSTDVFRLLSFLYLIDRDCYANSGQFVTGDKYYVTDSGIVPIQTARTITDETSLFHNNFNVSGINVSLIDSTASFDPGDCRGIVDSVFNDFFHYDGLFSYMKDFEEFVPGKIISSDTRSCFLDKSKHNRKHPKSKVVKCEQYQFSFF